MLRKRAELSLRAAAKLAGVAPNHLDQVERGTRPPFAEEHWQKLVEAIPGVTHDGLTWAAMADRDSMPIAQLSRRERLTLLELFVQLREQPEIPEAFDPSEAAYEYRERTMAQDAPKIADGISEVLGDASLSVDEIVDALIALGWKPDASNMQAVVSAELTKRSTLFTRVGKRYRRRA